MKTKTCPRCNYTYTWINESKYFNKNKANKDGLASVCKKCRSEEYAYYKSLKPNNLKDLNCKYVDCQKEFTPSHILQEYCSKSCRDKANKFKEIANELNRSISSCSIKYSNITKCFKK